MHICRWLILLCSIAFCTAIAAPLLPENVVAESSIENITEHRLPNGLLVVLAPDDKAQIIAFNLVYLTGALADRDGEGGTAHLLEHLLFKGTAKLPGTQLVSEMTRRGIQFNATTSHDRTRYQATLPADAAQLDWLLAMEADRMANARFEQADFDKEIPVVLREMEIAQSNPIIAFSQRLLAVEDAHGYGQPPLGTRGEVEKLTLKGVGVFYRTYYRPDNAVLVLSGKFKPDQALASIQQHFGALTKPKTPIATFRVELPAKPATRQVSIQRGDMSIAALAYPIPAAANSLGAEFGVLTDVLAGNPHGRLHQKLVTQDKAIAVAANPLALRGMSMFFFSATLGENQSIADARKHMGEVIEQLDRHPITEQELQRAQTTFRSIRTRILADPMALGNVIAENAGAGDWRLFFQQTDRVAQLSLADVQGAAAHYLKSATRISGEVIADRNQPIIAPALSRNAVQKPEAAASLAADKAALPASLMPKAAEINNAEIDQLEASIQRFTLNGGLQVAVLAKSSSGNRVQGRLKLRFGDESSLFGKRQIADLTASMLLHGTQTLTQQQLVDRLNSLGAGIVVIPDDDHVNVRFEAPRAALPAVLELVVEILRKPSFPEKAFEMVRQQQEINLKHQRNAPEVLANEELRRRTNPYPQGDVRRPPSADEALAGLAIVTRYDLVRFHADFYGADHGELAMMGDFDAAEVRQNLERLLGNWNSRVGYRRPPHPFDSPAPGVFNVPTPGKDHGQFLALLRLPLRDDSKDAFALALVNQILGGMPIGARLTERLRNQEGFSYTAGTGVSFSAFEDNGSLKIAATYPPARREQIQVVVHEELARLVKEGITPSELQQAKESLLQQSRRQDGATLNQLLMQARTGRSMQSLAEREAALASATLEEVNAVIRQYLDPAKLVEVLADAQAAAVQRPTAHD